MFERLVPAPLVDAAAAHLNADRVQRGCIVAWLGHNSWDMLATLVACERIGAVFMPLNWRLAAAELALIIKHAGASHLLGTPEMAELASQVLAATRLSEGPVADVQAGDLLLVYTSGTTGRARGAMHTRAGMQANALAAIAAQGLNAGSRVLAVLPLFHVGGLCIQTLPALAVGARLSLLPRFEAGTWFDAVERWRPTTTLLVPAVMKALIEHPRWGGANLTSLKFITSGSQIVPRGLIIAFHERAIPVAQVYGATESGPLSLVLKPDEARAHVGMAGRPAMGVQLRLAGDGEILLKATQMMRGYHRSVDPAFDADGWFHTGDLAMEHVDGMIEIVGRSSEVIISGGENIHPAEIEEIVVERPEVAACAAVGLPDAQWGEVPVLAVVLKPGRALDHVALQDSFDARLARFKHPQQIRILAALPLTALGKVQRSAVQAALSQG